MQITLDLPHEFAGGRNDLRSLLERFALEGYRTGTLTGEEVRGILGFGTRLQVHGFLKEHGVCLNHGQRDLEQDIQTLR